jgi:hypothetical protein
MGVSDPTKLFCHATRTGLECYYDSLSHKQRVYHIHKLILNINKYNIWAAPNGKTCIPPCKKIGEVVQRMQDEQMQAAQWTCKPTLLCASKRNRTRLKKLSSTVFISANIAYVISISGDTLE